jgi:hypothetical protein
MDEPRQGAVLLVVHETPLSRTYNVVESAIQRLCCCVSTQQSAMILSRKETNFALTRRHAACLSE